MGSPRVVPFPRLRLSDEEIEQVLKVLDDDTHPPFDELVELTEAVQEVADEMARDSLGVSEKRVREAMRRRGVLYAPEVHE